MTPDEFRAYLRVAREEGCTSFTIGDIQADLRHAPPVAAQPPMPAPSKDKPREPEDHWNEVDRGLWPEAGS